MGKSLAAAVAFGLTLCFFIQSKRNKRQKLER